MRERIRLKLVSDDSQAREIAELYWAQDEEGDFVYRVSEIADTYELTSRQIRDVANGAAIAESEERLCTVCGDGHRMGSRQDASSTRHLRQIVCEDCRTEEEEKKRLSERRMITDHYVVPDETPPLLIRQMKLGHAVGLYALIRQCADEGYQRILPVSTAGQRIAPHEFTWHLLPELLDDVIWVDPESDPAAFVWESGAPDRFYLERVTWRLAGEPQELQAVADQFQDLFQTKNWPDGWLKEAGSFQRRLAAQELADYLIARLAEHHLSWSAGEKTWEVLDTIADSYSIGAGYNLIWRTARDAAAFMVRERCSSERAAAWAVGSLRRTTEKAMAQGWSVKPFNRDWNLPRSEITHVFYELFLGESDEMLTEPLPPHASEVPANAANPSET